MKRPCRWIGAALGGLLVVGAGLALGYAPPTAAYHGPRLTNARWAGVITQPTHYLGAPVTVTGEFVRPIGHTTPPLQGVWLDPAQQRDYVAIQWPPGFALTAPSYLRIQGTLTRLVRLVNVYGATRATPVIVAARVQRLSRDAVVDPTRVLVRVPPAQTQQGLTIQVTRVEVAARATRVFVTAINGTGQPVTLSGMTATLTQGPHQLRLRWSPDLHDFPLPLAAGVTATAELVFQAAIVPGPPLLFLLPSSGLSPYQFRLGSP